MTRRGRRPTPRLQVVVTDARGRRLISGPAAGLGPWLARAAPRNAKGSLAIAVVSDAAMKRLNATYRGQDRPTDVLSFIPVEAARRGAAGAGPFLGDLAIASGLAARQATAYGHSERSEIRILALHGLLHLLGYDHEADRGEMGRLEERLRRRARLPSGLVSRR